MAALMTYHWQKSVKHTQLYKVIEELPPALTLREEFAAENLAWAEVSRKPARASYTNRILIFSVCSCRIAKSGS